MFIDVLMNDRVISEHCQTIAERLRGPPSLRPGLAHEGKMSLFPGGHGMHFPRRGNDHNIGTREGYMHDFIFLVVSLTLAGTLHAAG